MDAVAEREEIRAHRAVEPRDRAARTLATNLMVGPRMAMAMFAMAPYPFAWNPPLWTTALTWTATARAASLAFAAANPLTAGLVLAAFALSQGCEERVASR